MKNVIIATVIGAIIGIALMKAFGPASGTLEDGSGGVACGEGFFYNDEEGFPKPTKDTVMRMEKLAKLICTQEEMAERQTTNHRHTEGEYNGELKHAGLLGGEVCTINFELTPEAHLKAFLDVCVK